MVIGMAQIIEGFNNRVYAFFGTGQAHIKDNWFMTGMPQHFKQLGFYIMLSKF